MSILNLRETMKLVEFLDLFRERHARIETTTIQVFLAVAQFERTTQKALADMLGTTQATISRNLKLLASYDANGMGLVKLQENAADRRNKTVRLTHEGRLLLQRVKGLFA